MQQQKSLVVTSLIKHVLLLFTLSCLSAISADVTSTNNTVKPLEAYPPYPHIEIVTNLGKIYLELDAIRAPLTTHNFLQYVESGHYNNIIFHRVIPGFVAQSGGYDQNFAERTTRTAIVNESGNGMSNLIGSVAMARTKNPHSARSQFYINLTDNQNLDPQPARWGYTVFGEVRSGMPLLQDISNKPTGAGGPFRKDVPIKAVIIESMRVMAATEEIPSDEPIQQSSNKVMEDAKSIAKKKAEDAKARIIKKPKVQEAF